MSPQPKKRAGFPWRQTSSSSGAERDDNPVKKQRPLSPEQSKEQKSKRVATLTHTPANTSNNGMIPKQSHDSETHLTNRFMLYECVKQKS